jgi:hypothetical protein
LNRKYLIKQINDLIESNQIPFIKAASACNVDVGVIEEICCREGASILDDAVLVKILQAVSNLLI